MLQATGLKQRTAMLRMGGFIHKGYDTITQFMETIEYNNFMAQLACNGNKNRVNGPLAPSHTRVKLQRVMEDLGSDYINAKYIIIIIITLITIIVLLVHHHTQNLTS